MAYDLNPLTTRYLKQLVIGFAGEIAVYFDNVISCPLLFDDCSLYFFGRRTRAGCPRNKRPTRVNRGAIQFSFDYSVTNLQVARDSGEIQNCGHAVSYIEL